MIKSTFGILLVGLVLMGVGCGPVADDSLGTIPQSGTWSFALSGSSNDLTCPVGPGALSSGGNVDLSVTDGGGSAVMFIEHSTLVFQRESTVGYMYSTQSRSFPTFDQEGIARLGGVYFEFVANTDDSIIGTLFWTGSGCTGSYPFVMELIDADLPGDATSEPISFTETNMGLSLDEAMDDCDGDISGFTNLPDSVDVSYNLDLDSGEPTPSDVTIEPMGVIMERVGDTNVYAQTGDFDLGIPTDASGDLLLDFASDPFTSTMEVSVNADGSATGTMYYSSGACSGSASISLN